MADEAAPVAPGDPPADATVIHMAAVVPITVPVVLAAPADELAAPAARSGPASPDAIARAESAVQPAISARADAFVAPPVTASRPVVTSDIAPDVEIRYQHLRFEIPQNLQVVNHEMPNVWRTFFNILSMPVRLPLKAIQARRAAAAIAAGVAPARGTLPPLKVLDDVSGVIRPGTLTLLLAPPGHGKSAYLKALAHLLTPAASGTKEGLKGDITYSGLTPAQAHAKGVHLGQLVQYVSQLDEHLPFLTVRETLDFVHGNACVDPGQHGHTELAQAHAAAVDDIVQLLHLRNCMNTVVGNELLRGISGGEKKRVTVGEGLLTNARVLALDEISTGLDSAVTYDIVASLKRRAVDGNMAVIIALLQPTPEVYGLFDEILLLREGAVVYHGPRTALPAYLQTLGFHPPVEGAAQGQGQADLADWLVSMLTDPLATASAGPGAIPGSAVDLASVASATKLASSASSPAPMPVEEGDGALEASVPVAPPAVPHTTAELSGAWKASTQFATQMNAEPSAPTLELSSSFARAQYGHPYVHSVAQHVGLLLWRQFTVMRRNTLYIRSRFMSAALMSIILGGLYYQRNVTQGASLIGAFLNSLMLMSFTNMSEMATAVEFKYIAYKHVANGQHPSFAFPLSATLAHLPVALAETLLFTGILYGMSGMYSSASNYFVYWYTVFLVDIFMASLMRVFAFRGKTLQASQAQPLPIIAILIIFAGFLITFDKMPVWLFWINYIDIYGWGLRALAQNEFLSEKYSAIPFGSTTGKTAGQLYLDAFGMPYDVAWKWGGLGFMTAAAVMTILLSMWAFESVRFDRNIGSTREKAMDGQRAPLSPRGALSPTAAPSKKGFFGGHPSAEEAHAAVTVVSPPIAPTSTTRALPFQQMTVVFRDVKYTVKLPGHMGGGHKTLLHGITGTATPFRMLALMGASGAGKTTLLDVLGGRKNSGKMEGSIVLNGFPKNERSFNRVTAYVEQQDIHMPLDSVREALDFSAQLRLPGSVSHEQRVAFVDEIMGLLELTGMADRKVGRPGEPDGLAPAERKRLTIGVELASNAPVIFLDEPTSGLDSRAASIVMKSIRRTADTGRTVICTVHQPAADLFYQFDDLLLLQRGGYQAYFGPLGRQGINLVRYLEAIPTVRPCPRKVNVSSWMLETLAVSASAEKVMVASPTPTASGDAAPSVVVESPLLGPSLHRAYFSSDVWTQKMQAAVVSAMTPRDGAKEVTFETLYPRSWPVQLFQLLKRFSRSYNRNIPLNVGRTVALSFLSLIFGIVWYKLAEKADSQSGVQSLVACIFMTTSFAAMIMMNVMMPQVIGIRAAFYREQASRMYDPSAFSLGLIMTELPWTLFVCTCSLPISYFMIGLSASAERFFFHLLVQFTLASVYASMGIAIAASVPTFEVAQAIGGFLAPLLFLFGGLFSPPSGMVPGAKWVWYIDPINYAFAAIIPPHFYCEGSGCPTVPVSNGVIFRVADRYKYISNNYEVYYENRWNSLGYLALFIIVMQFVGALAIRYVRHIVR